MRTSKLRMSAVASALAVALGGCSTTTWSDMMSRMNGGNTSTSGTTQMSSSGSFIERQRLQLECDIKRSRQTGASASAMSSSSGASTTPGSGSGMTATASTDTIAQNSTLGAEIDTSAGTSARRAYAPRVPSPESSGTTTTSDGGTVAQNSASGAETNTIAGSSARRGYAQNQAMNAASASNTTPQSPSPNMSANAGQSGTMGNTTKSSAANTHDKSVVRAVQQALNDKGYNAGKVDGIWGPKTQGAVTKFQQSQGIAPTRSLDDQTLAALGVGSASPTRTSMQTTTTGNRPELASGQTKSK